MYKPGDRIDVLHIPKPNKSDKLAEKPPNVVIYTRVSYPKQALEGNGLEEQEIICKNFCKARGLKDIKVFREPGGSAYAGHQRKIFNKMIAFCKKHQQEIYAVVVFNIKRFFRDTELHWKFRRILRDYGIELKTPQLELGDTPHQKFMETVFAGEATYESDVKSVNAKRTNLATRRKGRLSQKAPIGYLNQRQLEGPRRTIVVHDPDRAPIIAEAFRMFAYSNRSKASIYRWATEKGLTNRKTKKPISLNTFYHIFENCTYAGIIHVVDDEYVVAEFEPIITMELFEAVQAKLLGDTSSRVPHSDEPTGRPLQGIVLCPGCGKRLTGSHRPGKGKKKLYGYYHHPRHKAGCKETALYVPVDKAEQGFLGILEKISVDKTLREYFEKLILDQQEAKKKEVERDLRKINDMKQEQENIKMGLLNLYALKNIDEIEYKMGKKRADTELAELTMREKSCKSFLVPLGYFVKRAVMALEHLDITWKTASETDKRKIAKTLFPDGLTCDKNGCVGTPPDADQFSLLTLVDTPKSKLATPTGIEPVLPA